MYYNNRDYFVSNFKMYECYNYVKLLCCYRSAWTKKIDR